jgi:hypothetical protein
VREIPIAELGLPRQISVEAVAPEGVREDDRVGPSRQLDAGKGAGDAEQILERAFEGALSSAARDDQRAVDIEEKKPKRSQAASPFTFPARGPLADGSSSKLTRCPSLSWSKVPSRTALR